MFCSYTILFLCFKIVPKGRFFMIDKIYKKINDTLMKYEEKIEVVDFCLLRSYIDLLFSMAQGENN